MKRRILLVGAGQLGSRHLQGLAKMEIAADIYVVDPFQSSLDTAKQRYEEVSAESRERKSAEYLLSYGDLSGYFDLAIIATTADVRAKVTADILEKNRVKSIIFEKVLFQSVEEMAAVKKLLSTKKVKAWVNCPRRIWPLYNDVKEMLKDKTKKTYIVSGGAWGLACNSVHFLDLFAYLEGSNDIRITNMSFDGVLESKRKGFIELSGSFSGRLGNSSNFIVQSDAGSDVPHSISIIADDLNIVIEETRSEYNVAKKIIGYVWDRRKAEIPYQSSLTGIASAEILNTGTSSLTSFGDSVKIHKPFLKTVIKHLNKNGHKGRTCPIT